ncbi:globin domain-containing protein [Salipiger mucosus]|uniref:Putative bacterial hemoglobin n=1 Tax=Salipiger mucosus DSM 16094 TaxID=1123237 RepID=S9QGF4_9RHOB|nr:globin domain-containing protein [Salipiger mucosus]EPX78658.1 Putative bacterial hemoglobin [Salipiger mucosus DSM 16094]
MLTQGEIKAIRASWLLVAANRAELGERFYKNLFRAAPEVRPMFTNGPRVQGRKLMETLAIVVDSLDDLAPLLPTIRQLGASHAALGVRPEHFDLVGRILLQTLVEAAGEEMPNGATDAWTKAYQAVASAMINEEMPKPNRF